MKKIVLFVLVASILLVSCSTNLPEDVNNREFYNDMILCLKDIESAIKTETMYDKDDKPVKRLYKYLSSEVNNDQEGVNLTNIKQYVEKYSNKNLTNTERNILTNMFLTYIVLNYYINYQKENNIFKQNNDGINYENLYAEPLEMGIKNLIEMLNIDSEN